MKNHTLINSSLIPSLLSIGIFCLTFLLSNTIVAQTNNNALSFWVSGNSGLYTAGYELDEGVVVGADINVNKGHHLWSLQMHYAPDYLIDNANTQNFRLYEYSGMYGYLKHIKDGRLYISAGISYLDVKDNGFSRVEKSSERVVILPTPPSEEEPSTFGVPIKVGILTHLSDNVSIGSAFFSNINSNKTYFGYQVSLQFGLFK